MNEHPDRRDPGPAAPAPAGPESSGPVFPPDAPPAARQQPAAHRQPPVPHPHRTRSRDLLLAGGGLAIGVLGTIVALMAWIAPRSPAPTRADVQITDVTVSALEDIPFEGIDDEDPSRKFPLSMQDYAIDLEVHNLGGQPALIRDLRITVQRTQLLRECADIGGGLKASALYDVRIPTDRATPFDVEAPAKPRFNVDPNSFDRLAVTVGPAETYGGLWLHRLEVRLELTTGELTNAVPVTVLGPVTVADAVHGRIFDAERDDLDCVLENQRTLADLARQGGAIAPTVERLLADFDVVAAL